MNAEKMNSSLLIYDKDKKYLSLIKMGLESQLLVKIIATSEPILAEEYLATDTSIKAIICDHYPEDKTNDILLINQRNEQIPCLVYTKNIDESDITGNNLCFLKKENNEEKESKSLIKFVKMYLNEDAQEINHSENDTLNIQLRRISPQIIKHLTNENLDLFIKLSSNKFVMVSKKEDTNMLSIIDHYIEKGLEYFFIPLDSYEKLLFQASSFLDSTQIIEDSSVDHTDDQIKVLDCFGLAYSISRDQMKALNISPIHVDFVNKSMDAILTDIKNNKNIFELLSKFLQNRDYLSDHSVLNVYFSSFLLKKLNWTNEQTLKQMTYACFYHDMTLDDPDLAKITRPKEISDPKDYLKVLKHGEMSATLLNSLKGLHNDAHKIIIDHHERPDGTGFPHGKKANQIPPLSCVFIMSHLIVDFLIEENFSTAKLARYIQSLEEDWDQGNFKRVFSAMRTILLE